MEPVMRAIRFIILVAFAALVLSPLTAAAQVPSSPAAKRSIETELSKTTAAPQEAKPEAKPAAPAAPAAKKPAKKEVVRTEPIVPAFSGIKEQTAVYVFYAWLWLSIAVLIYFLRLWVKEADRVYKAKYYEPEESPLKDNPMPPCLGD
jgi:hypothetical protein